MTTTQLTAVAEAKERITDAILNGAYHGHFVDMCVKGNWLIAEMHAKNLTAASMEEIKAHTIAEIAKHQRSLAPSTFEAALLWCERHLVDDPEPEAQALIQIVRRWQEAARHGRRVTVDFGDFVDGVLAERYGRPFPEPIRSELAYLVR